MARRTLLVALAIGCGQPPAVTTTPPRPVPAFEPGQITLAVLDQHVGRTVCSPDPAPAKWPTRAMMKLRVYDFSPIPIALAFGPTEQPSEGFRRYGDSIRVAIINHTDRLAACMRATIGTKPAMRRDIQINRGELVTVKLAMTIDPFGHAHDIAVDGPPQLVPCITATLGAMRVNRRTPRETRATVDLSFTNLQGVTHDQPPPPPVAEVRPGCLVARDPLPVDTIELAGLDIDFDPADEPRGRRRQRCERFDVDKAEIREMVRRNLGNLRACYLAAAKRAPGLGGTLTTGFVLGPWGQPTEITLAGAGDATFHDCVKGQLELMATQRMPDGAVQINLPFTLDPAPAHPWSSPAEALEAGDASEAALQFAKLGDAARDVDHACRARLGIVKAYANLPGGPDARTDKAVADLAAFLTTYPDAGCRDDAHADLVAIARWPVRAKSSDLTEFRGAGLDEAVARSTKIVALFPDLRRELLPFMGRALTAMHRDAAFGPYLDYFELGDPDPARVIWAADGYAESQREREDGVSWDTCEARAKY